MGRPLKIAKAQAILTMTATAATTNKITVSGGVLTNPTDGLLPDMPFVVATSTGNLVAGTTYWILQVVDATHITASETPLNANPNSTQFALGTAGPVTVLMSIGMVDTGFNNPAGAANTYGVVGGNTSIYGKQVLVNCAIGMSGAGTLFTATANANVFGFQTDFTNAVSVGSSVEAIAADGTVTPLGFVATNTGFISIAYTNATATGNFITTSGTATDLFIGQPVLFDTAIGGLAANSLYFVKTTPNASAFSVATTVGGANVALADEDVSGNAIQDNIILAAPAAAVVTNSAWQHATAEAGYIVRQKGKQKYLVHGVTSNATGACYTANVANAALTSNTFNILSTNSVPGSQFIQSLNDHTGEIFGTANVLPNSTPMFATFNTAAAANATPGQPYPLNQVASA